MSHAQIMNNLQQAGRIIQRSHEILLTTHSMPDGDGLGAEIALYHYLRRLNKNVRIMNPDPMPPRYQFLDSAGIVKDASTLGVEAIRCDLVIVVDTGDYRRLKGLWSHFISSSKTILFLDHHPRTTGDKPTDIPEGAAQIFDVIDERSSSIGELLYRLFHSAHEVLDPENPSFRLSAEIALGLYVSIMTDTNSFRYSRTTALSHRIAAELLDYGLQPEEIYQNIYSTKSAKHLRLIGTALASIQESDSGEIAWVEISREDRTRFEATGDDTQTIVNFLLLLKAAKVLILFREEDDGRIKVSLKSKGSVVVNDIAADFGGGGHAYAAGFTSQAKKIGEVRNQLLSKVSEALMR